METVGTPGTTEKVMHMGGEVWSPQLLLEVTLKHCPLEVLRLTEAVLVLVTAPELIQLQVFWFPLLQLSAYWTW